MKAYPDPVRVDVLLDRLDSEATGNAVEVYIHRIRKKLRAIGAPNPIVAMRNRNHPRAYISRPS
jgi:DNA-binding response OmpR family regulator